jgi:hypothetical protein
MKTSIDLIFVLLCPVLVFSQPAIDSIEPDSGPVGTVVMVRGSGFDASNNTVCFQDADMDAFWLTKITVASSDGKILQFTVPSYINPACYYETPPCAAPSMQTQNGPYLVYIEAMSGTSNSTYFNVTGTETPEPTGAMSGLLGDVNGNGSVDIVDALLVAQYYVGLIQTLAVPQNADFNRDGNVNIVDALLIAQYYVQ